MPDEVRHSFPLEDELPLLILRKSGQTIALTRDEPSVKSFLPFSLSVCSAIRVSDKEMLRRAYEDGHLTVVAREWPIQARVKVSLDCVREHMHWLVLLRRAGEEEVTVAKRFSGSEEDLHEVVTWLKRIELRGCCELCLASEPVISEARVTREVGRLRSLQADEGVNEQVFLGDSVEEVAVRLEEFLHSFFLAAVTAATAVFWPPPLTHPLNIHYGVKEMRTAEHRAALLPMRPLLHLGQRCKEFPRTMQALSSHGAGVPRTGHAWEKHLLRNIHIHLSTASAISGGGTFLVSGAYDYYHYSVDGFRDEGWGCAYRSLQTILSWFQYEGLMTEPMPDIRAIQGILRAKDPDKMNRKEFVGSKDWIGSFEVMIVIQHFVPGMECTIRRMESGADLETDPSVQQLLVDHFRNKKACPVMIGGSSYAHTILGLDANLATMEVRYLIADPHYSSGETSLKTVLRKGYVGWKEAGKFFESKSWYNLCIPQLASYDPR
ncbi:hypothetical protein TraAM80_02212 [Trypanosoma rangeli]|uniref:UFSP1/2/DUB catalytic domain-containing protein n=1 Tax=Trypanosoma rangeli TaxID=5698 RepID=A0A422NVB3_TRYRA|nr:uncharacterized protein TraAM80_02212 [Trypanosoma rangeli]RNF09413.1 hypothetical protein TraAM80_02212 [Trypanosoma rangeli]|eukprot:RNF09413.1 hypothetical protein TraAM80_02212 [Trypanosoma rangeli]